MKERMKKIGRMIAQGFLSFLAFAIVLMALLQIGLMIGFAAFNTGKGRDLIEAQLQAALADTGYDVSIGTLFYDPVRGINVYNVTLRDSDGTIATLDRLSVGVVLEKLALKDLELFASGGTLNIVRFPQSAGEESPVKPDKPLQPFTLPDIYFKRMAIDYFTMTSINLPSGDPAMTRSLSPTLRAEIVLGEQADIAASLVTRPSPVFKAMQVPDSITIDGRFDPSTLSASLTQLAVRAEQYNIEGKGAGSFAQDGALDFTLTAKHSGLGTLTSGNLKEADLNASLTGPMSSPVLAIDGTIVPGVLSERGLGNIAIKATGTDLSGAPELLASVTTQYQEQEIKADAVILYAAPTVTIETFDASAPFATLSGKGTYDLNTALADIALDIGIEKLAHYSALAGIDLSGALKAKVTALPQENRQALTVDAALNNGRYGTITVRKAEADVSFPDILHAYWPEKADIALSSLMLSKELSVAAANISLNQTEGGAYKLSLDGNGSMGKPFTLKGSSIIESFTAPLPTVRDIDLALGLRKGGITLKGAIDPQSVDLAIDTNDLRLGDLPVDVSGRMRRVAIDGTVRMTGTPAAPVTKADIGIDGLGAGHYEGLGIDITAAHENGQVRAQLSGKGTGIRTLDARASLPMTFALSPFAFAFDNKAAIDGRILADIDLAAIATLFLQPTQVVTGTLLADGTIDGSVSAPVIKGNASIDKASFTDDQNGIELDGIIVKSRFTQDSVNITTLQATDGENGTLNGSGNVSFGESGTDLKLAMTNFHLPKSNMANGFLNADLSLRDSGTAYETHGNIDIQSMDILIPETFQSQIPELNIVKRGEEEKDSAAKSLLLDIDVTAENQFFVRGWGLDAEFGGDLKISGSADEPLFEGVFESRRGRYEEFGKRFDLARANLRFQGTIPPSPYLDIEATTDAEEVVASVLISGPVQQPKIAFSSVPSLPEDEVLARILFGKSATKISPFQAIQLAQTVQRFSGQGGGGLDPLGTLRNLTGLDDISVETDSEGKTNVGAGKYLTDNVYLEFEGGAAENSGAANLQIEVTPSVTIESEIGQDAQGGGGVFWKHDY